MVDSISSRNYYMLINHILHSYVNILRDESDDDFSRPTYEDFLNQESFSSKASYLHDRNLRAEYEQGNPNIVIRIAHGKEAILVIDKLVNTCQSEINIVTDKNGISSIIKDPEFTRFYTILKDNSINIRIVTEIDQHNVEYCKKIIDRYGVDLRHFPDVTFNLAISDDKEYVGFTVSKDKGPFGEVIYSSAKEIVKQNKFIFDTLWKKSIPITQRRREIEEDLLPLETFMIKHAKKKGD